MDDSIPPSKVYACLWKCRDLEINMLWTRLTLVGTFMALTYAGYGTLILKGLDGIKNWDAFNLAAVGASVFGLIFAVLWTATAKGSKAWFERYEAMLGHFQETYKELGLFTQMGDEEQVLSYLDFNKRWVLRRTQPVDSNLLSSHAGGYSVSKIPIVMGQLSIVAWGGIGGIHLAVLIFDTEGVRNFLQTNAFLLAGILLAIGVVASFIACSFFGSQALKGES